MPTYSYICDACGICWQAASSIADRNKEMCGCGRPARIDVAAQGGTLNIASSELWNIPMSEFNGTPINVRSRRHFNELCRQYGKTEVDKSIADRLPKPEKLERKQTQKVIL